MQGSTENAKLLPPTDTTNFVGQGRNQCHFLLVQMIWESSTFALITNGNKRVNFKRKGKRGDIWVRGEVGFIYRRQSTSMEFLNR